MAIDTNTEKLALIHFGAVFQPPLPLSPGTLEQDDQQQLLWGYPGILWGAPAAPVAVPDSPHYTPIVAPADWRADEDAFSPEARIEALADDLEELERFIGEVEAAGDEFVDPWENEIDHDFRLLKTERRRGHR